MAGIDNLGPLDRARLLPPTRWIISNEGNVATISRHVISGITPACRIFGSERNVIASVVEASRYDAYKRVELYAGVLRSNLICKNVPKCIAYSYVCKKRERNSVMFRV